VIDAYASRVNFLSGPATIESGMMVRIDLRNRLSVPIGDTMRCGAPEPHGSNANPSRN
jgi:hypothetical protein